MSGEIDFSYEGKGDQTIRVSAVPSSMQPETCVFTVSDPLFADASVHFPNRETGAGSPLVERLFDVEHVVSVLVHDNILKVTLDGAANWEDVIPQVGEIIRDVLVADDSPISDEVRSAMLPPEEIGRRVQDVLDTMINPAIAAHGGVVSLLDVASNTVFLEFGGGCQGCGMINVTLKYGVERTIREEVPEVGEILDSTDHAAGRNPYYQQSSK